MMDFVNLNVKTKFCNYIPINLNDSKSIIEIRSSRRDSVLNTIDDSLKSQETYFRSYQKRFIKEREIYYKISQHDSDKPLGLVRITELDQFKRFNCKA